MSRELQAAFLLRLRYRTDAIAHNCGGDTDGMISSARSLAESWIDDKWYGGLTPGDDRDRRISSIPALPSEAFAAALREFWYSIVLAAKHSDSNAPQQQKIVDLISEKKTAVGTLQRSISLDGKIVLGSPLNSDKAEIARTPDGDIWADLPYFGSELFDAFLRAPPLTSVEQWTNLHAFAARITIAGLRDLSFYALWALFDTLEVDEMYPVPPPGQSTIVAVDRFDPVMSWFQHCGSFIFQACKAGIVPPNQGHDKYSCRWHGQGPEFVGHLAREAGIKRCGFSVERWAFWGSRLEAIRDESGTDTAMLAIHSKVLKLIQAMEESEAALRG